MNDLNRKAFEGLAQLVVAMAFLIFVPAWTIDYLEGWTFLGIFSACCIGITAYLMKKDPALLARRMNAGPAGERERSQKLIQSIASAAFVSVFVVSALDHRFAWSLVSANVVEAGDFLVIVGLLAVFLVFKENTFTSAIVEVVKEQRVISTGPYAIVRHPMYAGAFVMLIGMPLSLGSFWGIVPAFALAGVIVRRLLEEERFLEKNLVGYSDYQRSVRSRLLPGIW